jgi:hypothetical protein
LAAERRGVPPGTNFHTEFHPGFQLGPTLDKDAVETEVENLIKRIAEVPRDMEDIFSRLYRGEFN